MPNDVRSRLLSKLRLRGLKSVDKSKESKESKESHESVKPAKVEDERPKGPLGLNTLYEPEDGALVDIIFVHGLAGDSRKTWSDSKTKGSFWPQSWLPEDDDFKHARIHSFGYNTNWRDRTLSILSIHDFGEALLAEMSNCPSIRRTKGGGIIMVGHSMGGCVAKKAYVLAKQNPMMYKALASRFRAFLFLATPHRGSSLATLIRMGLYLTGVSKPYLRDLSANSAALEDLNDSFLRHKEDLKLWSFYETRPVTEVPKVIVVDKESATLGCGKEEEEVVMDMDADHRSICKYKSTGDENYKKVRDALSAAIEMARSRDPSFKSAMARLKIYLGGGSSDQDDPDLLLFQETRLPGSCAWLMERGVFKDWVANGAPGSSPILWLTGKPGSGKSVLSSTVVDMLNRAGKPCSYYFFHHGQASSAGFGPLLGQLAYQMALKDAAVREKILSLQEEGVSWSPHDERSIWRKLFLQGVLDTRSAMTHFWVVDGLDECSGAAAFMRLLHLLPTTIRVFVASRNTPEIDRGLVSLSSLVEIYFVSDQDTISDMRLVIEAGLRFISVREMDDLGSRILARSSGSFIWVRFVLQELEKARSAEDVEEILRHVPEDLYGFYGRIVSDIASEKRRAEIARSILFFVVLAVRPMTTEELRRAVQLDVSKTMKNMEQLIRLACGQLVTIDQGGRVRMVHETARNFLLSDRSGSALAVSQARGHGHFARLCLSYLDGLFRSWHLNAGGGASADGNAILVNYASTSFSQHLLGGEPSDDETFTALLHFVDENILRWIQYIAEDCPMSTLTRTSMDMARYTDQLALVSPLLGSKQLKLRLKLRSWATDLSRVALTFRDQLRRDPSAIHDLIPALCPTGTSISESTSDHPAAARFLGLRGSSWDESFMRIETGDSVAVAYGESFIAMGMLNGEIAIYDTTYLQHVVDVSHPGILRQLEFGYRDKYLVSSCRDYIQLWDPKTGARIVWFECHVPKALSVSRDFLLVAQSDGELLICDLNTFELQGHRWMPEATIADEAKPWVQRRTQQMTFCKSQRGAVAAVFWTNDAYIFDTDASRIRGPYSVADRAIIRTITPNLDPQVNALVVTYTGDRLAVFDVATTKMCGQLSRVPAEEAACSPDGRLLMVATKKSEHAIEIFRFTRDSDFVTLVPVHRISYPSRIFSGMTVAADGIRFATLHGFECRIWDPSRSLVERLEAAKGSATEAARASFAVRGEVSAMAISADGGVAVCGTDVGEVVIYSGSTGLELGMVYQDEDQDLVSDIALVEREDGNLIITAHRETWPPGSHIVIARVYASKSWWSGPVTVLSKIEQGIMEQIRVSPAKDRLLLSEGSFMKLLELPSAKILCTKGIEALRPRSVLSSARSCPSDDSLFMVYTEAGAYLFHWMDGEPAPSPGPFIHRDGPPFAHLESRNALNYQDGDEWVELLVDSGILVLGKQSSPARLNCWTTTPLSSSESGVTLQPRHGLQHLSSVIKVGVCMMGSTFVFVDVELWVCTVDVRAFASTHVARRHFFVLPEWTGSEGWIKACRRPGGEDLVFANRRGVVVVRDWMGSWQTVRLYPGREAWEAMSLRSVSTDSGGH